MRDVVLRIAPPLGRVYMRLVGATTRYRFEGREAETRARANAGAILWAFWHNRLLGPLIPHRNGGAGVVISRSRDGELVSRVIEGFGYTSLRGSTTRGGASVLRAVLRHVRQGFDVAFTPDGPKGPRYQVQPGAAYAARRTGLPVIPIGVGMSRKAVFGSWDRFQLPLPFGTIQLVYGNPLEIEEDADDGAAAERIRVELQRVTERADELLGVTSP